MRLTTSRWFWSLPLLIMALLFFSLFNNMLLINQPAHAVAMSTCGAGNTGFGGKPVTANVLIKPAGAYEAFDVTLKDSNDILVTKSVTCLPAPGTSIPNTTSTATQAIFGGLQGVAAGIYKVCYNNVCTKLAEKTDGNATPWTFPETLVIEAASAGVPVSNMNVVVNINLAVPAVTEDTNYEPIEVSLIGISKNQKFTNLKTLNGATWVKSANTAAEIKKLQVTFQNVSPDLITACLIFNNQCKNGEKEPGTDAVYVFDISEAESVKLLSTPTTSTSTCMVDSVGWIVCPVVNFLAGIADGAYQFIEEDFLNVKPEMFTSGTSSPTYAGWTVMRNIANVAFVIAFLVIIFSQLTGFGINNYGIKKLLPKIVIAAILVNLSFFICQIAVDLSNIFGKSLSEVFSGIPLPAKPSGSISAASGGTAWADTAGFILAGGVGAATIYASLSTLIPVLISAVFALVMILFIMVARQALIVLLVVVSPLAFVAFLLPNTDKWFQNWRKMFFTLLLLYPIVALIYGVSGFASAILSGVMTGWVGQVAAAAVMTLPLFVVPSLLKKSLDGVGNIGAALNNLGGKMGGMAGKKVMDDTVVGQLANYKDTQSAQRRAQVQSGTYKNPWADKSGWRGRLANSKFGKLNPRTLGSAANKAINTAGFSGNFGNRRSAQGESMAREAESKAIAAQQTLMESQILADTTGATTSSSLFSSAIAKGDATAAKAALNLQFQTASGRTAAHGLLKATEASHPDLARSLKGHVASAHPSIDSQDAALGDWSHKASSTLDSIEADPGTYQLNDSKMAGQSAEGLAQAVSHGTLDAAAAIRILRNETLSGGLKPTERAFLNRIATGGTIDPTQDNRF